MSVFVTGYGDPINIFRGWWVKGDCLFELLVAMPIEVSFRADKEQIAVDCSLTNRYYTL